MLGIVFLELWNFLFLVLNILLVLLFCLSIFEMCIYLTSDWFLDWVGFILVI